MLRVDGAWIVEPCADRWVKIPRQTISCELHRQRQYDDTLPSRMHRMPIETANLLKYRQQLNVIEKEGEGRRDC
ncbi:putative serine/threonine-protein kinase-like [Dorcoceras hygrometricum]|uniref:Putative serine/threonine-protein kinase-like n=1 Tax=Dorcoceras hygrometricum TaxID=472368 RepID=A0A2Z7BHK9_9LAMI|nr:putative serine/threonine-protein kinase-like [Dorcoceras hygrometricum]